METLLEDFIEVKESGIHGKGMFTSVDIPAGSRIMIISGEVIDGDECEKREELGNVYIFWNEDNYIDVENSEKLKYLNHKCDYNCEIQDRDAESLFLTAAVDIPAGEELTIDYGYEEIYDFCRCSLCA